MPDVLGMLKWGGSIDKDGHREYEITWLIEADYEDGPFRIFNTPGLPAIGSSWMFGNDFDPYALCWPNWSAAPTLEGEQHRFWTLKQTFTTKPLKRCQDEQVENPLAEPPKISGSFVKYTKEVDKDRHGKAIKSSSHEIIKGSQVEFDFNRPQVQIEMNVLVLPLGTVASMVDTVNDSSLWGLGTRRVKLSDCSWRRQLFGVCGYYYTVSYGFDICFATFDKKFVDEGTKVLVKGGLLNNPIHFKANQDMNGNIVRIMLDGFGNALADGAALVEKTVEYYQESNMLLLGIPTSL